ncbi:MAG: sodium:solute symporter family protein [Acidobacteriota bacterium]|nr:sodium:solute symporter family protein [Acidobacteriota bacterium]
MGTGLELVALALSALAVSAVAVLAVRGGRRRGGAEELFLAGRQLPLWVGALTMTATWVGGGFINGTAEAIYDPALGLWWCQAPVCYALSLAVGGAFFAGPMRRAGYTTMLDPFQERYGTSTTTVFFVTALCAELFWSAAILAALGAALSAVAGIELGTAILVSAAIVVAYTSLGGLRSVAYTDVLQLGLILVGLVLVLPFALEHAGGLGRTAGAYLERQAVADPFPGRSLWRWTDTAMMLVFGGVPWQVYFQRVLACRDERSARRLSYVAAGGCLVLALPPALIGATGATVDWAALGLEAPASPAQVLPHVISTLAPPLVAGLALAAVTAAVMSSTDSSILSASSMVAWNFVRPALGSRVGERALRRSIRVAVVVVGAVAALVALEVHSVYALWFLCSDLVYVVLFPQLVIVLWMPASHRGAVLGGVTAGLLLRFGAGEATFGLDPWIAYPLGADAPIRTVAMLANASVTLVLSAVLRRRG